MIGIRWEQNIGRYLYSICLFWVVVWFGAPLAAFPISMEDSKNYRDIGRYFEFALLPEGQSSLTDALSPTVLWLPNPDAEISFPRTKESVWLRTTLVHYGSFPHTYFLHFSSPVVDEYEFYYEWKGKFLKQRSGEQVLQRDKPIYSHMPAFPITLSPDESRTIYVKITSVNPIFNFVSIYNSASFLAFSKKQDIFYAAYFGAGIMVFLLSLFLSLTLRYRQFFFYFFYLATIILINSFSTGFMQYIEFGNSHVWKNYTFPITIYLTSIFGLLFTMEFLETKKEFPRVHKLVLILLVFYFVMIFTVFVFELRVFIRIGVFLVVIPILLGIIVSSISAFRTKTKVEPYLFLFALSSVFIGGALNSLTVQGFLKPFRLSLYSLPIGSAIVVFFLNLALIFRVYDLRKTTEEKNELDLQLKIARRLQNALLPKRQNEILGLPLGFKYTPASDIGGDFIQTFTTQKEIGIFLCDVSGHGIPAAMIASMTRVSLQIWKDNLSLPAFSGEKIRESLLDSLSGNFLSAIFLYINLETKEVKLANAGLHPMLYLSPEGNIESWTTKGRAINEFIPLGLEEKSFQMPKEGKFILYTDGVTEARNQQTGELFGEDRFFDLIKNSKDLSPQQICDVVIEEVEKFQGSKRADDDITILVLGI